MQHFVAAFASLPEGAQHLRKRHFEAFLARGLPSVAEEDWRYTDLAALAGRTLALAAERRPDLPALAGSQRLAFANGRLVDGDPMLAAGAVPELGTEPVASLNAAFALAGLELEVPAGQIRPPLHLVTWFGGTAQGMAHLRHRVWLGRGAAAALVLHELGDDAPFFATQVLEIELAEGAHLRLDRIQQFGAKTTALTRIDARLARDARLEAAAWHGGGALVRNDVVANLEAQGADASLRGVLAPVAGAHLDVHTRVDHRAPHGRSRETFRCVVPAKAHAVFNGKVVVHPDAQKTDSEQHVDSLLLAPGAEVNAKPELEIFADDVKCAHGATCGQLDERQLYYLRSRGLDLPTARRVLVQAFAGGVLDGIAFEPARELARRALERHLG